MPSSTIAGRDPQTGRPFSLLVEQGVIARVDSSDEQTDLYLAAGFIDLQVNGCCGFDVNAEHLAQETIVGLVDAMLARGVTCFVPTIITAPEERICRALQIDRGHTEKSPQSRPPAFLLFMSRDRISLHLMAIGVRIQLSGSDPRRLRSSNDGNMPRADSSGSLPCLPTGMNRLRTSPRCVEVVYMYRSAILMLHPSRFGSQ